MAVSTTPSKKRAAPVWKPRTQLTPEGDALLAAVLADSTRRRIGVVEGLSTAIQNSSRPILQSNKTPQQAPRKRKSNMPYIGQVAQLLKNCRLDLWDTQKQTAHQLGLYGPSACQKISAWETGASSIHPRNFDAPKFAEYLRIPEEDLIRMWRQDCRERGLSGEPNVLSDRPKASLFRNKIRKGEALTEQETQWLIDYIKRTPSRNSSLAAEDSSWLAKVTNMTQSSPFNPHRFVGQLAKLIRETREKKGLTQADIAHLFGFYWKSGSCDVSHRELGVKPIRLVKTKPQMAMFLDISIEALNQMLVADEQAETRFKSLPVKKRHLAFEKSDSTGQTEAPKSSPQYVLPRMIREARERKDLFQADIAHLFGLTGPRLGAQVSARECGTVLIRLTDTKPEMADFLDITVANLDQLLIADEKARWASKQTTSSTAQGPVNLAKIAESMKSAAPTEQISVTPDLTPQELKMKRERDEFKPASLDLEKLSEQLVGQAEQLLHRSVKLHLSGEDDVTAKRLRTEAKSLLDLARHAQNTKVEGV